jgi:hypothetical protein
MSTGYFVSAHECADVQLVLGYVAWLCKTILQGIRS